MSVHEEKGKWFVKYRTKNPDGSYKQHTEWFGAGEIARVKADQRNREILRQRGKLKEDSITVSQLCMLYHETHPVRDSTYDIDNYKLKVMLPHFRKIPAEGLTTQHVQEYIKARLDAGKKRTTISREIRLLKAAFSWAESQEPPLIIRNPIARFKFKFASDKRVPFPPSLQEVQKIYTHAEPHMQRAILILWETGIRPGGELERLTWEDVDFFGKTIRVTSASKGGPVTRNVPFEGMKEDLARWFEEDKKVFEKVDKAPIIHFRKKPVTSLKRAWKTAKERAGVTRELRPYDIRHAFVSGALRSGADLKSVSEIIGHSRPDTTLREYQHVTTEQHRDVVRGVPVILREVK